MLSIKYEVQSQGVANKGRFVVRWQNDSALSMTSPEAPSNTYIVCSVITSVDKQSIKSLAHRVAST